MATPITQLLDQKKADISAMQESFAFLEKGSEFPVDRSQMPVLRKLEVMLSQASSEAEKVQRLQMAREALVEAERELRQLESEVAGLEAIEEKAVRDLNRAIAQFNQLGEQQAAIADQMQAICQESARAIARLRGRSIYCPPAPKIPTVTRNGQQLIFG